MRYLYAALLCVFLLCGCVHQTPLHQTADNVVQIELLDRRASPELASTCTLAGEQAQNFMEDLEKLKCIKRSQPTDDTNVLEIRIYYSTGDMDLLGSGVNGYLEDGEIQISGWYYYSEEDLQSLFAAYMKRQKT